ncbi:O-antigen ligase family protein [Mucilaginibacter sp. UR6-1]|uniref:O-antigen ligase family protein n=1 Tax=Mucilaginibacter sp. UR6-1 TaxID=1435643 RepID=UPI001E4287FB|nr:O-antigen ligase family protein [Mucilaginibacter sp. UR6-1]
MDNFQLKIDNSLSAAGTGNGLFGKLKKLLFIDKLNNGVGIALLLVLGVVFSAGIAKFGAIFGALIFAAIIAVWVLAGIIVSIEFGILVLMVMAFMLFMLMRIGVSGPIGILMDALQVMLMISSLVRLKRERNWELVRGPVSIAILVWIGYNVLQFANPMAESRMAWVYSIRTVAIVLLSYFVFVYNIRTLRMVRIIFKLWLVLGLIAALYAYKQEYIGFSAVEDAYLHSDPEIAGLLFIGGHWRKFSIFSDPVVFAYNMVMVSIICICIAAGKFKIWQKVLAIIFTCLYLQSMLFSGTRGANVLLPAAMVLFAIMNYNKKVLVFAILGAMFLLVLINIPTSNPNIVRFQTAFRPNNDDSYNLRKYNQKRIQPYIQTHPFGGGLGATGTWGKRFAPGSYLANFPPDSGYIRVAVELGPIGLIIFCTMVFTILRKGINYFYRIRDPELRTYCLAMTLVIFAYNVANFPQEALVQYPSNILFSVAAALITVTYRLDREQNRNAEQAEPELIKY